MEYIYAYYIDLTNLSVNIAVHFPSFFRLVLNSLFWGVSKLQPSRTYCRKDVEAREAMWNGSRLHWSKVLTFSPGNLHLCRSRHHQTRTLKKKVPVKRRPDHVRLESEIDCLSDKRKEAYCQPVSLILVLSTAGIERRGFFFATSFSTLIPSFLPGLL